MNPLFPLNGTPTSGHLRRRRFLQFGLSGALGLSLPEFLHVSSLAGSSGVSPAQSAILVWLAGGPSHLDTFDPKPDGVDEVHGEYQAIDTRVPGVRFSSALPELAARMDRLSVVRSVTHRQGAHEPGSAYMISGYAFRPGHNFASGGGVVAHERHGAASAGGLPPYIALPDERIRGGGHLGAAFNPLSVPGDPSRNDFRVQDLSVPADFTTARVERRRRLSEQVNRSFRESRQADAQQAVDQYTEQAYAMLTSPAAQQALDVQRADEKLRDRYGRNSLGQRLLLASRLVQTGVPFVTVADDDWDHHRGIYPRLGEKLPRLDQGVSTLLADLDDRGLLDSTLVVVMGEFGRTSKINATQGRDHWSQAFSVMLAGGGIKGGTVVGETDGRGEHVKDRPVTPEELYFTLYSLLGINPEKFLPTSSGREIQIIKDGALIEELVA